MPILRYPDKNPNLVERNPNVTELKQLLTLLLRLAIRWLKNNDLAQRRADEARQRDDAGDDA